MQRNLAAKSSRTAKHRPPIKLVNHQHRFASLNVNTCPDGAQGESKLCSLTHELEDLNIGILGMQEFRKPKHGSMEIPAANGKGHWGLLWSGHAQRRERGVALLMSPAWAAAMDTWEHVSDRLLMAQFTCNRQQTLSVIVAYAPTEGSGESDADHFYESLSELCTHAVQQKHVLVVLGDFNAAVGKDCSLGCIGKHQPMSEPEEPSANGQRLLTLTALNSLRVTNTFFKHPAKHQFTHTSFRARARSRRHYTQVNRLQSVKDYILISARHMRSVRDCRTYRNISWESDHNMLAMSLRLTLRATVPVRQRREWDSAQLCDPDIREKFCVTVRTKFEQLAELDPQPELMDSAEEFRTMVDAVTDAAKQCLKPPKHRPRQVKFDLSPGTMELLATKQQAHQVWLRNPTSEARAARNKVTRQADRAVQRDMQRHMEHQARVANKLFNSRDMRGYYQHSKRMAGRTTAHAVPTTMRRDAQADPETGTDGVLNVLTSSFQDLLGGSTELSNDTCNKIEADVLLFEAQHPYHDDEHAIAAACPTIAEVAQCIDTLRNLAAPGADQIDARMLKAGPIMHEWMHRIISAVWKSGKCPPEWKSALIVALYKGKGAKDIAGNYRGISLLSIAGKVYAIILMHRVYQQVEPQLHEAQSGFRRGRGTVDAIYTLRALGAACSEYRVCMAKAYIDFTKAYDSVNRWLLWKALRLYGVHTKIIALLEDLHDGTHAAVRLGGQVGPSFRVVAGVRQGCVIAPTLFNVMIDLVIRRALARMPEDCGIRFRMRGSGATDTHERIVLLMYADDVVLMSSSVDQLVCMLKVMDQVACEFGMKINASKTKIQVQSTQKAVVPRVYISSGVVDLESLFRYLGSLIGQDCSMDKEIEVRRARTVGAFESFSRIWDNRKLGMKQKMAVYNAFIVPHFLYGCEAWNCTASHLHMLETAHSACLRRIMGVDRHAHHSMKHIYKTCHSHPVTLLVIQHVFKWLGHVHRMPTDRFPRMVYDCVPEGGSRPPGRPKATFRHTYDWMLEQVLVQGVGVVADVFMRDLKVCAQDRGAWRALVKGMSLRDRDIPTPPTRRSARLQTKCHDI